jgi:cysteinyl-tRNA synthetase
MLRIIDVLVKNGHAYETNGSVYFRTLSFPGYGTFGALPHACPQEAANKAAAPAADDGKEDPRDFALWKAAKESDDGCVWQSPYGKGRPGWHIECSAMCQTLLGETVDIHAGGVDLQFPHHQNEMVQSEAATGKQFCKHWLHNGFLTVGDAQSKMSKSLGAFRTLRDVARTPLQARAFRHFVVSSHYRAPLHFNEDCIVASANALTKVDKLIQTLQAARENSRNATVAAAAPTQRVRALCEKAMAQFANSMSDDMHTPTAVTALYGLCNEVEKNAGTLHSADAAEVLSTILEMDKVFGLFYEVPDIGPFRDYRKRENETKYVTLDMLSEHVQRLIKERTRAKQEGNFELADQLRYQLNEQGYQLIDCKTGTQVVQSLGQ